MTQPNTPSSEPATPEDNAAALLWDQLRSLWKHRWLILAIMVAVVAVAALRTMRSPRIYEASTSLEFDPNPPRPLGQRVDEVSSTATSYWSTREYYTTQYQVLQSQRVAEGVVRQLGLQHDADFLGVPQGQRANFHSHTVTQAAQVLRQRTKIEPVRESRLVMVRVEDTVPRRAQLLANTMASVYIRQNLEQRLASTVSALEWLGQQLDSLQGQLNESELALHRYREDNNLLSVSFEDRRNHVANRLAALSTALTEAQTRRIGIAARVAELQRAARAEDPLAQHAPELLASVVLGNLRAHYEEVRRERDGLRPRYGAQSQQMLAIDGRLDEIRDAIRHEVENIARAAEAELRSVRRVEGDLRSALDQSQHDGLDLNLREIGYGRLLRARENNSKMYNLLLERTKETEITRLLRVNNIRVLDDAMLPVSPVKPRVLTELGIAALGGFALGMLVAFALVQADRSVRSPEDIKERLHETFLGLIPAIRGGRLRSKYRYGSATDDGPILNPDMVVHTHPNSVVAEACRVVRTNLLFMSPDKPLQLLTVTSGEPREGKTTTAASLAISLAQSVQTGKKRVLLVDADLRRPRVHKAFKVRAQLGLTTLLVGGGETTLEEAVVESEVPNLSLLLCGPVPPNPAELLQSQRFAELVAQLREHFDWVVFDTPPVGAVTDALIISPRTDAVVLVARARKTQRARTAAVLAQLRSVGARIAGMVLNDVDLSREGEGYYYYYAGSYDYRPTNEKETA